MKILFFISLLIWSVPVAAEGKHGLAMHGDLKYAPDFEHFDYVDPDAKKGGVLRAHSVGSFDSLNGFILKGTPAASLGLIYDTLMENSDDEAFSEYGRLAESVEVAEDNSFVRFNLRKNAKFHDGENVTPEDVVWSFETLKNKGLPFYRAYYGGVKKVSKTNDNQVTFTFKDTTNKELPLILGQIPVLPKHYWKDKKFEETTLVAPTGSGPYKIKQVDAGKRIVYERVKDYWGANIPVNKGRYNFDEIVIDYYRDATVATEALLSNDYDYRLENIAKSWATTYKDSQAVKSGKLKLEEIKHERPAGMQAFAMNLRRPVFNDIEVRKAINLAFDYEWSNKQFAYGSYTRTDSYFENSELASFGVPRGKEKEILKEFEDQLPEELFKKPFRVPRTNGSGNNRKQLREAMKILDEAGYVLGEDGIRVHKDTKQKLVFDIILNQPAFERWVQPFVKNLKKIGIQAKYRTIDSAQYQNRVLDHDYDMTVHSFPQSLSPGNEQFEYWHSSKVDVKGSRNWLGIKNDVVDALIQKIIHASDRDDLVAATRALDRVLLWNYYVVPQWHLNSFRVAYWDKFGRPDKQAPYDLNITDTWWMLDE